MNFDFYRTFYYVGKYQSITAAAKALYVTQPTVTHAIQSLEREHRKEKNFILRLPPPVKPFFRRKPGWRPQKIFQRASSPSEPVKQHCTIISYQSWLIFAKNIPESI